MSETEHYIRKRFDMYVAQMKKLAHTDDFREAKFILCRMTFSLNQLHWAIRADPGEFSGCLLGDVINKVHECHDALPNVLKLEEMRNAQR